MKKILLISAFILFIFININYAQNFSDTSAHLELDLSLSIYPEIPVYVPDPYLRLHMGYTPIQPISLMPVIYTPPYIQGDFCDFEDAINAGRKLRIDFSVK